MSRIISLSILAMAISMASAAPSKYGSVKQISDNDVVDTKDTVILADVLKREPGWRHNGYRQPSVVQYNDNDAVDLKGLTLGLDILKREPTWRHNNSPKITQINDNDLLDLKDTTILADILKREPAPEPRRWRHNNGPKITQINDNDLLDLKDTTILADILKREPKVTQINDDDGVDTKDTVAVADVLKRNAPAPSVFQYSDNDLVDAKDLTLLADILKRSGYEVEKRDEGEQELESRGLGGDGLFFRRDRGDQRCVCVKKTTCNKSPKQYKAKPEHTRTHHWKPTQTWTKTRHHYQAEPTRHHNNDWSCPSGFGDITQINDNDLIDLKDTSIILNILGGNAADNKEESVPARDARSRCHGRRCCVKNSSITQINDNDLIDAKGVSVSVGLLNGLLPTPTGGLLDNIAKPTGGLLGGAGDGLLGGLGL